MPVIDNTGTEVILDLPEALDLDQSDESFDALASQNVITFKFNAFADGRAFSWAGVLRSEGYNGLLIGVGEIGLDRLGYGFRAGFDLLEISEEELKRLRPEHISGVVPPASYTRRELLAGNSLGAVR